MSKSWGLFLRLCHLNKIKKIEKIQWISIGSRLAGQSQTSPGLGILRKISPSLEILPNSSKKSSPALKFFQILRKNHPQPWNSSKKSLPALKFFKILENSYKIFAPRLLGISSASLGRLSASWAGLGSQNLEKPWKSMKIAC